MVIPTTYANYYNKNDLKGKEWFVIRYYSFVIITSHVENRKIFLLKIK